MGCCYLMEWHLDNVDDQDVVVDCACCRSPNIFRYGLLLMLCTGCLLVVFLKLPNKSGAIWFVEWCI